MRSRRRPPPDEMVVGPWQLWPFNLTPLVPAAARAAAAGQAATIILHFQRTGG